MKTTLGALALAAVVAAAGVALLRDSTPSPRVYRSPGQETGSRVPGGFTVRGRVTHEGAAVPKARVVLTPLAAARRDIRVMTPVSFQAVTDEDGRFELAGVPAGPARLAVFADRLAPSIEPFEVLSDPAGTEASIALLSGIGLEGRVTAGEASVAGARVSVWLAGYDRPLREGPTDAEGRYAFEGLDGARPIRLVILARGHRPFEKSFRVPTDAPDRIDLEPGLAAAGRVMTSSGAPIDGAEVTASQGEGYVPEALSGPTGEIRLGGLVARPLSIRVFKDGFAPARLELAGPSSGWTITLRRNGGLAGRAPAGAWLVIESAGATFRRGLGDDGSFHWEGLPPGPAEARATDTSGRVLAAQKVEIPEGEVAGGILLAP